MAETIHILSDPDSSTIVLNGNVHEKLTPTILALAPGDYSLEVFREGYDPLPYELQVLAGDSLELTFVLMELPLSPLPPESLGLAYMREMPLQDEDLALQTRQRWNNAAEVFAIIPLGQGVLGRLFLGDERKSETNLLIASGLVLSLGSMIIGRKASKSHLNNIRKYNEMTSRENESVRRHNYEIEQALVEKGREREAVWVRTNQGRGRVKFNRLAKTTPETTEDTLSTE